jgi:hypothetical protein
MVANMPIYLSCKSPMTPLGHNLSCVNGTAESKLSGVTDTAKSKHSGVIGTTESVKIKFCI